MKTICRTIGLIDQNLGTFFGGMCFGGMLLGWAGMAYGGVFAVALILYSNRKTSKRDA